MKSLSPDLERNDGANVPREHHGDGHHLHVVVLVPLGKAGGRIQDEADVVEPGALAKIRSQA